MKKSRSHESVREEAERLDALKEGLEELPFTRLRRYAKEPSQVYAIRIPVSRLEAIRWLADRREEQPTALLREWVLERLDEELAGTDLTPVREVSPPYVTAKSAKRVPRRPKRAAAKKTDKASRRKGAAAKKR